MFNNSEEKMHKNEDNLVESSTLGTRASTLYCFLKKSIFHILIHMADMANLISTFGNFDMDQISLKLAQRWHFISNFYCKKNSS